MWYALNSHEQFNKFRFYVKHHTMTMQLVYSVVQTGLVSCFNLLFDHTTCLHLAFTLMTIDIFCYVKLRRPVPWQCNKF